MFTVDPFVALALGALIILTGLAIIGLVTQLRGKASPPVQAVIDALMPYIYKGILAGEHFALFAFTELDQDLEGVDRKRIAASVYDALPDYMLIGHIPIPIGVVKTMVPREQFETLIEDAYRSSKGFILKNETFLKAQVDALQNAAPVTPPPPPSPPPAQTPLPTGA